MAPPISALKNDQYTIGWLYGSTDEGTASFHLFDKVHGEPQHVLGLDRSDARKYKLGSVGKHNIVMASTNYDLGPSYAPSAINKLIETFPNIRFFLMIAGNGGGLANYEVTPACDIRLGDVVVGFNKEKPERSLVPYSVILAREEGPTYNAPPKAMLKALDTLNRDVQNHGPQILATVKDIMDRNPAFEKREGAIPDIATDRLFQSDYQHESYKCEECDTTKLVTPARQPRSENIAVVHQGTIATAGVTVVDTYTRDRLIRANPEYLCMDDGLWIMGTQWPCLVIRGVSHYADSHFNDDWISYATLNAGAYAKILLNSLLVYDVRAEPTVIQFIDQNKDKQ
ncbi:hypothetical protein BJX99DRAFT_254040 [Aspergillus californicus]